ncbi:RNA polymerase sigma factor (sigma-70 family) [Streptomyces sp. MJP52]|nr:RNA polymerase sigma factor (sigma-70 family) [Streptomyces sp. MJP52]
MAATAAAGPSSCAHVKPDDMVAELRPLLAAEAAAEAAAAGGEARDLEQGVWLRLLERLERSDPPRDPARWLRQAVRAEVRALRRAARREHALCRDPADETRPGPEQLALASARRRTLQDAVRRLPGRCPRLLAALFSPHDLTYREIARELGMSQGSLGPERSRCLGCLRRLLGPEVAPRPRRG